MIKLNRDIYESLFLAFAGVVLSFVGYVLAAWMICGDLGCS